MNLKTRLARLEDTLRSRSEIAIEDLKTLSTDEHGNLDACVRFYDDSRLFVFEDSGYTEDGQIIQVEYSFHYQHADGILIFRYDNSPHFPDLPTFPAHKHTPDGVIPSVAPDLADVLREIDERLYPDR